MKQRMQDMDKALTPTVIEALKKITNLLLKNKHDPRQFATEDGCIQISRHRIKHMFYIIVKEIGRAHV